MGDYIESLGNLACWLLRAGLTPEDLAHESLELLKGNFSSRGSLDLRKHLSELFVRQVLTLSAEGLFKIGLCDESGIVNVEVMESESHVGFRDCSSAVDGDGKELTVVDFTVSIKIDALKDLINFLLRHVQFIEGSPDLAKLQRARAVGIERSESISQFGKIKCASVHLVNQEGERGNLQSLRLTEVLDATQDHHLIGVQKLRVVSGVVLVDIV